MIAQDGDEIRISIGTFDTNYLEYLNSDVDEPVVPKDKLGLICKRDSHYLTIQEFGPVSIKKYSHIAEFARIVVAIMIWLVEGKTPHDNIIKKYAKEREELSPL